MSRILKLKKAIESVVINGNSVSFPKTNEIKICFVTDTDNEVNAMITFVEGPGETFYIPLWEGKEYLAVGDWVNSDVDQRIKEILNLI